MVLLLSYHPVITKPIDSTSSISLDSVQYFLSTTGMAQVTLISHLDPGGDLSFCPGPIPCPHGSQGDLVQARMDHVVPLISMISWLPLPCLYPRPHSLAWCTQTSLPPLPGAHSTLAELNCTRHTLPPSAPAACSTFFPTPSTCKSLAWLTPLRLQVSPLASLFLPSPCLGHVSLPHALLRVLCWPTKRTVPQMPICWSGLPMD